MPQIQVPITQTNHEYAQTGLEPQIAVDTILINVEGANYENITKNGEQAEPAGVPANEELDDKYGKRTGAYDLRERRKPKYDLSTLLAQLGTTVTASRKFDAHSLSQRRSRPIIHTILTQYGMNKGLKLFKRKGDEAVHAEMKQLHDRTVMRPMAPDSLTITDRSEALRYLMFLKEKRDGTVKGRGCADGRKQRGHIKKK